MKRFFLVILPMLGIINCLFAQNEKKDYLHIQVPIRFDNINYNLSDTYNPNEGYYKQEYIPKGESPDKFNNMITIDLLVRDITSKSLLTQKVKEIEAIKKTDPVANYKVFENAEKGEYMLDFLLSQSVNDKVGLVEWNVYRYTSYIDAKGRKGVLLIAYSMRGYGNGVTDFFTKLEKQRIDVIGKLGALDIPTVHLEN